MRFLPFMLLLQISFRLSGQGFLIDYEVQKIIYKKDSMIYETPLAIEITTLKTSEIVDLGKVGKDHFGVQFEILSSNLGDFPSFIAGRVYFIKSEGMTEWKEMVKYGHSEVTVEEIEKRQANKAQSKERIKNARKQKGRKFYEAGNSDSAGDPVEFRVYYEINVYASKK